MISFIMTQKLVIMDSSKCAVHYLSTSAAMLSTSETALLISLSPMSSEAPCSSAVFCRRLSVMWSLQETTCTDDTHVKQTLFSSKSGITG